MHGRILYTTLVLFIGDFKSVTPFIRVHRAVPFARFVMLGVMCPGDEGTSSNSISQFYPTECEIINDRGRALRKLNTYLGALIVCHVLVRRHLVRNMDSEIRARKLMSRN